MNLFSPCGSTCSQLAEKLISIAILLYLYNYLGKQIFSRAFFRQLVYVFQTIRIFIILAGILPLVLHKQADQVLSRQGSPSHPLGVLAALAFNLLLAFLLMHAFRALDRDLKLSAFYSRPFRGDDGARKKKRRNC